MNIQTDQFTISNLDTTNPEALYQIISQNRSRLEDFFAGTVKFTKTLEDTTDYCKVIDSRVADKSYFPYIVSRNGLYIGLIDVKNIDWNIPKAELGYFIDSAFEGKGIISKAVAIVIDYITAEYKFKKLLCRVGSENLGSAKIAQKNGFELEGTIRLDYRKTDGQLVDLQYFGRVF